MQDPLVASIERLELLEAEEAHPSEMLSVLRAVESEADLWRVADGVVAYVPIVRMIFRRARELGASPERARGYLALAHLFNGDEETAAAIVGEPSAIRDPILLGVWAHLTDDARETVKRLETAITICPESHRLQSQWREASARLNDSR